MSAPGELIADRYRLVTKLGSGGMGVVWEAWDERLERRVAVKQLHPQRGLSPAEAELANNRAMREARINARLHHRYAVPVFDVAQHEGQPCLIMQFVASMPLSALLREGGPLQPAEAAQVGSQIAAALAAAHQAGIVHRDVKPGNILIADDGTALISDFGISHAMGDATLTETGMVHGTPAYIAPEVARGGEASYASDVFSLGATLYAALEGAPPFGTDQNSIALLHRVATGEFEPPQRSGALTPVLLAMLAADPAARPAMPAVVRRLTDLAGADLGPAPADRTLPVPVPTPTQVDDQAVVDDQTRVADRPPFAAPTTVARTVPVVAAPEAGATASAAKAPTASGEGDEATVRHREPRRRRGGAAIALATVVAALILATALWFGLLRPDSTVGAPLDPQSRAPTPSTGSSSAPDPSPSATPSPSTTPASASPTRSSASPRPSSASPTPSSAAPSATNTPSATRSTSVQGQPTAAELARAIADYYALMPAGTDQAWSLMTTSYRANTAGGRRSYERFWGAFSQVSATDITGSPPDRATATITYVDRNGQVSRERTSFRLVEDNGVLKINASTVL